MKELLKVVELKQIFSEIFQISFEIDKYSMTQIPVRNVNRFCGINVLSI